MEIDEPANGTFLGGQASNGIIRFDASEADNISFTPNPHFSGDISLAFKVFSEERFGSKISEGVEGNLTFTVVAVADTPNLS